jgi:membrane-bound metal-dependent hydrolase YbcI (DUF457 family)
MFIGHLGIGFATKRALPRESLGVLLAAPIFLDLLWPIFVATGVESVRIDPGNTVVTPLDFHHYPWSHSLVMALVWSAVVGAAFFALRRDKRTGLVLGASVFSHWLLDFISHSPDLPLYPGGTTQVGLGLWNSLAGTLVIEAAMFAIGVAIYVKTTRPASRANSWLLGGLVVTLVGMYLAAVFGPPPPNVTAIVVSDVAAALFLAWGAWVDKKRNIRAAGLASV